VRVMMIGRMSVAGAVGAAMCLMLVQGALAQSNAPANSPQKPPETVVVTGQRGADDVNTIVSQFVDLHAARNRKTGQYMRDDAGPLCPVTLGLPPAFDTFVTARLLAVAAKVGARTGVVGACRTNVEILFTDEPEQVVQSLSERTRGAILGVHYVHETRHLLEVTHPIQAWYVTGTRYDQNATVPVSTTSLNGTTKGADDRAPAIDAPYHNVPDRVALGSRIPMRRISAIANVLIVADLKEVGGRDIGPVSDYIAMLALSEPASLDECNALPSILDLMAAGCDARARPAALTDSDMAYLRALYAADLGATTNSMQKDNIANGMKDNLDVR
jgi:hypothetical protein